MPVVTDVLLFQSYHHCLSGLQIPDSMLIKSYTPEGDVNKVV